MATSTENGGLKRSQKNSGNQNIVKGLTIMCTETGNESRNRGGVS